MNDNHLPATPATTPGGWPALIFPEIPWLPGDVAHLQTRLDFYEDFITLTRFAEGQPAATVIVDPAEVAAVLSDLQLASGLLPPNTLFWAKRNGAEVVGYYIDAQIWTVSVRRDERAWQVPLPPLVMVGCEQSYQLWAVAGRPASAAAPLYLAPVPNVHAEGVCQGNVVFPPASPAAIRQAVEAFFRSRFNDDLGQGKSKQYPAAILDQWQALHAAGATAYPLADLLKTSLTIGDLMMIDTRGGG